MVRTSVVQFFKAAVLAVLAAVPISSSAVVVNFALGADDFGTLTINGVLLCTYDNPSSAGGCTGSMDMTPGVWYDIVIQYQNRTGSDGLALYWNQPGEANNSGYGFPGSEGLNLVPKLNLRTQLPAGGFASGLNGEYANSACAATNPVIGEGPINAINNIYNNQISGTNWNGCGYFDTFGETLTGQIRIAAAAGPKIGSAVSGLVFPMAVAAQNGVLFIADRGAHTVFKYDPAGPTLTPFAGTGTVTTQVFNAKTGELAVTLQPGIAGFSGDGTATGAMLNSPSGVAVDANGNVYIADTENNIVRKVPTTGASAGIMSTVAGVWPTRGFGGDGGPATAALLAGPRGVAVDPAGNLYIADSLGQLVRGVDVTTGVISTLAGVPGATGDKDTCFQGDCPPPPAPHPSILNAPLGVAAFTSVVGFTVVYVAEEGNRKIRTISGGRAQTYLTGLGAPSAVASDRIGNIYYTEPNRHVVRRHNGEVTTTIAGLLDEAGSGGDGGAANVAALNRPVGVALDENSDGIQAIYIVDLGNRRIRKVQ
jgi:hypothetical protein